MTKMSLFLMKNYLLATKPGDFLFFETRLVKFVFLVVRLKPRRPDVILNGSFGDDNGA